MCSQIGIIWREVLRLNDTNRQLVLGNLVVMAGNLIPIIELKKQRYNTL